MKRNRLFTVKGYWSKPFTVIIDHRGQQYKILNWKQYWSCKQGYFTLQKFGSNYRIESIVHV